MQATYASNRAGMESVTMGVTELTAGFKEVAELLPKWLRSTTS